MELSDVMQYPHRLIVAGPRCGVSYKALEVSLNDLLYKSGDDTIIITGGAKGVDTMASQYAANHGFANHIVPADWDGNGRSAGFIRNAEMLELATGVIAIWNFESKGTEHMIKIAIKRNLKVMIAVPPTEEPS